MDEQRFKGTLIQQNKKKKQNTQKTNKQKATQKSQNKTKQKTVNKCHFMFLNSSKNILQKIMYTSKLFSAATALKTNRLFAIVTEQALAFCVIRLS